METLSIEEVINNAPRRWKSQYPNGKEGKYEALIAAQPLTKEKVDAIIGNDSWTRLVCDECNKEVKQIVTMDNSEYNFGLCKECLTKALKLIKDVKSKRTKGEV